MVYTTTNIKDKEKTINQIIHYFNELFVVIEKNKQLHDSYYHKIIHCKELINTFEFYYLPQLLEDSGCSDEGFEVMKQMKDDIKCLYKYVKAAV